MILQNISGLVILLLAVFVFIVMGALYIRASGVLGKIARSFDTLGQQIPSAEMLQQFHTTGQALTKALEAQNLSHEIRTGIEPLQQDLHNALMLINTDGYLSEWVNSLQAGVEPFTKCTASISDLYTTANKILSCMGDLAAQWSQQRRTIEITHTRFAEAIENWTVDQTTHSHNIEQRIRKWLSPIP